MKKKIIAGILMVMMLSMTTLPVCASELQAMPTLTQAVEEMSQRGQIPLFDGTQKVAICYASTLVGENNAQALVGNIAVTKDYVGDKVVAAVLLTQKDTMYPGMNTFYAVFYDANGQLIKMTPVFNRDLESYQVLMLEWYIPKNTASVVIY